jgi:hypothetical protein
MRILLIFLTLTFATELEVEGSLKVTGGIDAQGQPITNVGNPVNPTDAVPMSAVGGVVSNMMSLSGMSPPERIYFHGHPTGYPNTYEYTVPEGKLWIIILSRGMLEIYDANNNGMSYLESPREEGSSKEFAIFPGYRIWTQHNDVVFNIYEYSITSSGNSQGMDYVEP